MSNWIKVGKILKTKGFDGTLIISFDFEMTDRSAKAFFIQKNKQYIPLLVEKMGSVDEETHLIRWVNYSTKERAQALHNQELFLPEDSAQKHFLIEDSDEFIGYEVFNGEMLLGIVIGLIENNFQETLEIKLNNDKILLIPFIEQYVDTIDEDKQAIYCHVSEEFIETFSS